MELQKIYITFIVNDFAERMHQASVSNQVEEMRAINQRLDLSNNIWKSWVLVNGGDTINLGGPIGRVFIGADHLEELSSIHDQFIAGAHSTVSLGVGLSVSEADKAAHFASLEHTNKMVFYTPEIEAELKPKESTDPLDDVLGKAEHPMADEFEKIVVSQETKEQEKKELEAQASEVQKAKTLVAGIIAKVRSNAAELEKLKEDAPEVYESIMQTVQALILIAKQLREGKPLQKAQAQVLKMNYLPNFVLPTGPGTHGKKTGGRIKVETKDGKTVWRSVRAGLIMDNTDGTPTSSRNPGGQEGQ